MKLIGNRKGQIECAMTFSEDNLLKSSMLKFIYTRRDLTFLADRKTLLEPNTWLVEMVKLSALIMKEVELDLEHPKKKYQT